MGSFDQFRQDLSEALARLYDPDFRPSPLLYNVMGNDPQTAAGLLQSEIIQVIQDLALATNSPAEGRPRRLFNILYHRFVLKMTQEETADRLYMSERTLRREQREATHALAQFLWEHSLARKASEVSSQIREAGDTDIQAPDWRSQVKKEMASLQASSVIRVASVSDTISSVVELERVLASRMGISLQIGRLEANLMTAIHPSVLRQILIMAVAQMTCVMASGEITFSSMLQGSLAVITLTGSAIARKEMPGEDLIREIVSTQGGFLDVVWDGKQIILQVKIPAASKVTVLVVEDNADSVRFYERCTSRTRYHIVHAEQGQSIIEAVEASRPDIIVLDIILPDTDGWDLLRQLHASAKTRAIPVIICSIIKEENLASSLGAVRCLPKPVRHRDFIEALDRALEQEGGA